MYDETNAEGPEFRVRTVVRYLVTRFSPPHRDLSGKVCSTGSSKVVGEFQNEQQAFVVAQALANSESGFATMDT